MQRSSSVNRFMMKDEEGKNQPEREKLGETMRVTLRENGCPFQKHTITKKTVEMHEKKEEMEVLWLVSPRLRSISSHLPPTSGGGIGWEERSRRRNRSGGHGSSVSRGITSHHLEEGSFHSLHGVSSLGKCTLRNIESPLRKKWRVEAKLLSPREKNTLYGKGKKLQGCSETRGGDLHLERKDERERGIECKVSASLSGDEVESKKGEDKRKRRSLEKNFTEGKGVSSLHCFPPSPPLCSLSCVSPLHISVGRANFVEDKWMKGEKERGRVLGIQMNNNVRGVESEERVPLEEKQAIGKIISVPSLDLNDVRSDSLSKFKAFSALECVDVPVGADESEHHELDSEEEEVVEGKDREKMKVKKKEKGKRSNVSTLFHVDLPEASSKVSICPPIPFFSTLCFSSSITSLLNQMDAELGKDLEEPSVREEEEGNDKKGECYEKKTPREFSRGTEGVETSLVPLCTSPLELVENRKTEPSFEGIVAACSPHPNIPSFSLPFLSSPSSLPLSSGRSGCYSKFSSCISLTSGEGRRPLNESCQISHLGKIPIKENREGRNSSESLRGIPGATCNLVLEMDEEHGIFKKDMLEEKNSDKNMTHSSILESSSPPLLCLTPPPSPESLSPLLSSPLVSSPPLGVSSSGDKRSTKTTSTEELKAQVYELFTYLHLFFS